MCDEREGGEKERGDICSCKTLYEVPKSKSDVRHHINNGRNSKNPTRIRPTVKICLSTFGHDAKIFSLSFLAGGGDIVSCTQSSLHALRSITCRRAASYVNPGRTQHYIMQTKLDRDRRARAGQHARARHDIILHHIIPPSARMRI